MLRLVCSLARRPVRVLPGQLTRPTSRGPGVLESAGVGDGFDDVAIEREPVDDRSAEAGICEGLGPAEERSLEAIATEAFSSHRGDVIKRKASGIRPAFEIFDRRLVGYSIQAVPIQLCARPPYRG